ncbi:hypothetical protein ACJJTC_008744 [Scirpophaga incertulas]
MSKYRRGKQICNMVPGIDSNKENFDIENNFECQVRLPGKCKEYVETSVDQPQQLLDLQIDDTNINKTYAELSTVAITYNASPTRNNNNKDTMPSHDNISEDLNIQQKVTRFIEDEVLFAAVPGFKNIPETIDVYQEELYGNSYSTPPVKKKIDKGTILPAAYFNENSKILPEDNRFMENDEGISDEVSGIHIFSETRKFQENEINPDKSALPAAESSIGNFNLEDIVHTQEKEISEKIINSSNNVENQNRQSSAIPEEENDVPPLAKKYRHKDPEVRLKLSREKHPMGAACKDKCIRQCTFNITEEERRTIWQNYWNLDVQRRRDFISRNVENNKKATRYSNSTKRNHTYVYKLLDRRVCKTMFIHTLGYTNDQAVSAVMRANFKMCKTSVSAKISAAPDMRGRHNPKHALSADYVEEIDSFIELFHPTTSHYRLEHAPNRRYLPSGLTLSRMFIFLKSHLQRKGLNSCSWATFHKRIKLKNISTQLPMQDKCSKCEAHDTAHPKLPREENIPDHVCLECNCEVCGQYPQHIINKKVSRDHMNMDNLEAEKEDSKIGLFTVDMQKCITMPQLYNKEFFFSRKLNLFNETFAGIGKGNKASTTMLWHEGESGRKAFDVATAYILFLKKYCRDYKTVILYADNCNAQNKNKILYSALLRLINDCSTDTLIIKIEYLEPGHTYMSADSVHGSITNKLNRSGNLYDLNDYVLAISTSRKNLTTHVHDHNDVMLFKNELKSAFPRNYNILSFKIVEFRRGEPKLFVKTNYQDDDFKELDVLTKIFKKQILSTMKKNDLLKLLQFMPKSRHQFFENLIVNEEITEDLDKSASELFE